MGHCETQRIFLWDVEHEMKQVDELVRVDLLFIFQLKLRSYSHK